MKSGIKIKRNAESTQPRSMNNVYLFSAARGDGDRNMLLLRANGESEKKKKKVGKRRGEKRNSNKNG